MTVLITGICGFVGSTLARALREQRDESALGIVGIDNLCRPGSELNRRALQGLGITVRHGDVRLPSDLVVAQKVDWVIDASANPSVLAGVDGRTSSRQLVEHNLLGTVNLLELCKQQGAGFLLLSTSRVYSIPPLANLAVEVVDAAFRPAKGAEAVPGLSQAGVNEQFSTSPPVSLYGATKVASECLALEYHHAFGLPVWINRCGVMAGAGQFGHPAQGIFSYWINAHLRRRPLRYVGFGGTGHQVRDCLHPRDLVPLLLRQMEVTGTDPRERVVNVSGGIANSMSLAQLNRWCDARFGMHPVEADTRSRLFDIPWMVLDSTGVMSAWDWSPHCSIEDTLEEIAEHARRNPEWLDISSA